MGSKLRAASSESVASGRPLLLHTVLGKELINSTRAIDELLLAGEEWVALRADFNVDVLRRRTRVENVATSTGDGGLGIFRMNPGLHFVHSLV